MHPPMTVSHEVHLWVDVLLVEARLDDVVAPAGWDGPLLTLHLQGPWRDERWLDATTCRRRQATWAAGRAGGPGWVDLVPAGRGRSLLAVALQPAGPRSTIRRRSVDPAWAVALSEGLRALALGDTGTAPGAVVVTPLVLRPQSRPAAGRPALGEVAP